jgi:hypothetical protein
MSVVSSELGVGAFEGWISHRLWLLDTILPLCKRNSHSLAQKNPSHTRSGEPSSTDYAETWQEISTAKSRNC